jgi:hypothetical protein
MKDFILVMIFSSLIGAAVGSTIGRLIDSNHYGVCVMEQKQ